MILGDILVETHTIQQVPLLRLVSVQILHKVPDLRLGHLVEDNRLDLVVTEALEPEPEDSGRVPLQADFLVICLGIESMSLNQLRTFELL